jgi:hypothetical protein
MDSALTRVQLHFQALSRPNTHRCQCPFSTTMLKRVYTLPKCRGAGRSQAGMSYYSCSHTQLGLSHSENRTTERPGHRAHSGGSRDRTASTMERRCRPDPHVWKLLGPMEIPHCGERMIKNKQGNSPSEQSEQRADQTTWWTVRSFGCQQNPG